MSGRYKSDLLNFLENNLPVVAGLFILILIFGMPILASLHRAH